MGGGAAVLYAATQPEHVRGLALIEGLGVPDTDPQSVPDRFAAWLRDMERVANRERKPVALMSAVARIRERFPQFSPEVARHMAQWGTRAAGTKRVWKFDPLHQTRAPQPTYAVQARAFCERVSCPVLYIEGAKSGPLLVADDLKQRLKLLGARRVTIDGSAHHPHLEQPEALAGALLDFLRSLAR
jgi:pimeloyl-ACP methyl ester carboxylesterase